MKVFASTLAAFAIGQESSDKWTGFDYDYGFGDNSNLQKNQASQSSVGNTVYGQFASGATTLVAAVDGFNPISNYHGAAVTGQIIASPMPNIDGITYAKMELGNGRMCWFCDSDSKGIKFFFYRGYTINH